MPSGPEERALDRRYRAAVAKALSAGARLARRAASAGRGAGPLLVGEGAQVTVKDAGTALELAGGAAPALADAYCLDHPAAVQLGMPPHWRFQDPGARQTRILIQGGASAVFHANTLVTPGVFLSVNNRARFELGAGAYIGHDTSVTCRAGIAIGAGSMLAQQVHLSDYDGHPVFRAGTVPTGDTWAGSSAPIRIGRGVWVGFRAIVLKGVTIGDGAIIGAGAVVTRSIPPNCAAAGNPAKVVKRGVTWRRF